MKNRNRKGFTLIELLIVIAIIAVLAVVVILSLNPAELLRQARDSGRLSDMATLKSAVSLYLADVASPYLGSSTSVCYTTHSTTTTYTPTTAGSYGAALANCVNFMNTATSTVVATTTRAIGTSTAGTAVPGNGWIPVDFANISSGSPIGQEPLDPTNQAGTASCASTALSSCGLFYAYGVSGTNFKLVTFMESTKYTHGGGGDVETSDGGMNAYAFEGGTNPQL